MKRFFCALFAIVILSLFCIPVSAATCDSHMTEGMPVGAVGYFEAVDNDTHNVCYNCDICNEKVIVRTEVHDVSEVDNKCNFCGFKVHTHTFHIEYEAVNEDAHIERSTCPCGHVVEEEKEHEFFTIADDLVCTRCGLQVTDGAVEDIPPSVGEGENQTPPVEENTPPVEENPPSQDEPPVEENPPSKDEPPAEDNPPLQGEVPEEDEGFIISQFFEEKVLPFIISAGSALVMFIGALVPYIKKSGKFKRLQGVYTATKAENAKYAELLATVDFEKFKEAIETVLTEDLKKKIAELGNYDGQFEEMKTKMELLLAQMQAMRDGAMNAWAQSPAAVAALSVSPTETAVRKLTKQNSAFEAYIKAQKGEEAEKIIAELKGDSHDEQGNVSTV